MKKVYINPDIKVVKLQTMGVLAGSWDDAQGTGQGKLNGSGATGSALSNELFDSDDNEEW